MKLTIESKFNIGDKVKYEDELKEIEKVIIDKDFGIGYKVKNEVGFYKECCFEKVEILEEKEKEYLGAVIKPFRDRVKYLMKRTCFEQWITIYIVNECSIQLPCFPKDKMYKGMEAYKQYTLEELGL